MADRVLTEKETVIGRLYALRAGLSVVAQEKEKADGIVAAAEEERAGRNNRATEKIKQAEDAVSRQNETLAEVKQNYEKNHKIANSACFASRLITLIGSLIVFCAIMLIGIYVFGMFLVYCLPDSAYTEFILTIYCYLVDIVFMGWQLLPGLVGLGIIIGGGFFFWGVVIERFISITSGYREKLRALNMDAGLKAVYDEEKRRIDELEKEVPKVKREATRDRQDADVYFAEERKKATEHAVAGLAMINSLEETFGDLVDMRDWANTDILIYALETRRAENIKEALQVVDNERHTERIEKAVTTAGQEICKTINMGLKRLQSEMTRCFGILSDQLVIQSQIISNEMGSIRSSIDTNNTYLSRIASSQNLNNALLAQANRTSADIADDVTRLRTAAEYSGARRLCG